MTTETSKVSKSFGDAHSVDSGLASLLLVARIHNIGADADQIRHVHAPSEDPFDSPGIIRAGRDIGLRLRAVRSDVVRLARSPLPAIAKTNEAAYVVVAAIDEDRVLVQQPGQTKPEVMTLVEFAASWSGELILVAKDPIRGTGSRRFGWRWFVPALKRHRRLLVEVLIASFFLQLFALVTPLFFQVIIDKVLVHNGLGTLDVLAIGLMAMALFEIVLGGLRTYLFTHTSNRIDVLLGAKLFAHLLRLPLAYFAVRRVGDSVARVRELEQIRQFLTGSSLTLLIDMAFTVVFFAVLFLYSPLLASIVLGSVPAYVVLSLWVTPILRRRLDEKFQRGAENQAFLVETVSGMQTVKSMAVEPQVQQRWEEQLAAYVGASFRAGHLGNIAGQAAGLVNKVTLVLILWVGATLVIQGALTVGQLIAFNMIATRVSAPVLRLVQLWQDFQQAGLSLRRLGDIMNTPAEPGQRAGRSALPALQGGVRFEHVSFRYAPDRPYALDDVSIDVRPGEVVGIVGRSGSGKSTLTALLQRLHATERGRVLVDGVDLALVDPSWLRRQVGVVLQDSFLFNRSVRDNIALAHPGAPLQAVVRAAKLADAHEFILELPEGYDTLIEEQGVNLSGGQRQRIAIARALLTDPAILVLDEATSALDYEAERTIQRNMRAICAGRTVFIIAHRLGTVRLADRILVMEQGRVVEQGNHDTLMQARGRYARLYAMQHGLRPTASAIRAESESSVAHADVRGDLA